ncbi:MAG: type II toxin-antitoxin system HicB family antitoxin [Lachnospiraceae bacterium]|nr:type II toxin-antitoxin system HicB family antitoxin [Lachnospiraceae bacterium]MBR3735054.1 type II toxin-antitoxin system HicB family antitoxin [Lachnospiraceae bacterium]MBR6851796.1 type II toxin-antitoxin system HicB family antitoxin [Lachnospiraceae bacterium]
MGTSPEVWLNLQNTYDQKLIEIVQDYKVLSYYSEEDGCYLAQIPEFAGCIADGSTPEEAIKNVKDLGKEWIELAIEDGKPIPAPTCNNLANITTEEEDHATELP